MTDPITEELQALAQWVLSRVNSGSEPEDISLALSMFEFEAFEKEETLH